MIKSHVLFALALFAATLAAVAHVSGGAAIIGIDFGSRFIKVALVKPGRPFEIVLNVHSKRKPDTVLAVDKGERLYGSDAANLAMAASRVTRSW